MVDTTELQQKLCDRLKPSGWFDVMKTFLLSKDFVDILNKLVEESNTGKRWAPRLKQVFRAFEECPYDKLKVVIIGQDPYFQLIKGVTVADGIAFSVSNTLSLQPSLDFICKAIKKSVYPDKEWNYPMDLACWSKQGVLLLNIALTTTIGKVGTHYQLWKPFMVNLLDTLSWSKGGIIYVYLGQKARDYSRITNDNCYKLYASHPASAGYQHLEEWDDSKVFLKINELLNRNGKEEIKW